MSDVVGSAKFELRADRTKLKQDIAAAERDLKVGVDNAEKSVASGARGIGGALAGLGGMLSTVATSALAVVAGLALVGKAGLDISFAALKFADGIADTAKRIGIGTDALQEWRFVAQQTGEDAAAADKALDSFATKLAQATAGTSKEAMKGFGFLNIGPNELKGYASTEAALDDVIDKIKELKNEADRAAVAEALGLGGLSVALRDGAVDVAALRDEARALGLVMDAELIQRGADASEEFDKLSQIIDGQLKSAFIDLAPAILGAIRLVAELATALAAAMDSWRRLDDRTSRGLRDQRQRASEENAVLLRRYGSRDAMGGRAQDRAPVVGAAGGAAGVGGSLYAMASGGDAQRTFDANQRLIARIDRELGSRPTENAPTRSNRAEGSTLNLPETPERTRRASIDRSAEREARRAERVEQDIFRAKQRLLQVAEGDLLNAQERADLARHIVNDERAARDAQIASQAARGEINEAELEQLNLANEQADILEDQIMRENALRDVLDEEVANRNALADLTANLVSLQIGAVRTAQERQRLELELLAITQRQRRDRLELELNNNPALSDAERQQRWDLNGQIEQMERQAVARANLSPLQQWRDEALKSAAEVSEAYESIAASGLDALNEGIVDAIMGTKSLGEVFSQVAKQILADLLSISVRRGITEPLANALFGGGGTGGGSGGGGGFLSSIGSAIFGGLRGGAGGGGGGFSLPNILGNVLGKITGTSAPAAASSLNVKIGVNDDRFNAYVDGRAGPMASQAASAAVSGARAVVPADMAQTRRYTR